MYLAERKSRSLCCSNLVERFGLEQRGEIKATTMRERRLEWGHENWNFVRTKSSIDAKFQSGGWSRPV